MVIHSISSKDLREETKRKLAVTPQYYSKMLKGIGTNNKPIKDKTMKRHFIVAKNCFKSFYNRNQSVIKELTA